MEWENLDTHNNLHSFYYGHYNPVLLIGMRDIGALDLQEKLFIPSFSLKLMFIHGMRKLGYP